jgi:hypothetical protein
VVSDSIVVDATPPEVSATTVGLRTGALGTSEASLPLSVRWEARDATAGLADARVAVSCGEGRSLRSQAPGQAQPGALIAWDAEAFAFPEADCNVTAIAVDGAGNTARATSERVSTSIVPVEDTMSATISGSEFGVIARRGPDAGRMAVLLDGEGLGLVDLWAESEEGPAVVFVAELPPGEHTVSVEPTDGSDAALTVDGFATLEPAA